MVSELCQVGAISDLCVLIVTLEVLFIYTIDEEIVRDRKELGIKPQDILILLLLSKSSASAKRLSKMSSFSVDYVRHSLKRLISKGLIGGRNGSYSLKRKEEIDELFLDEDIEKEDILAMDRLDVVAAEALKKPNGATIADFWKLLFEESLGQTCVLKRGPSTYSKIGTALRLLRTPADLMVCMEFVISKYLSEEPIFPGWDIRLPTVGFFCSGERLQGLMSQINSDNRWLTRRAKLNLAAYGSLAAMSRKFPVKEFQMMEGAILEDKRRRKA